MTAGAAADEPPGDAARPGWTLRRRLGRTFLVSGLAFGLVAIVAVIALVRLSAAGDAVISRRQPAAIASQRLLADARARLAALGEYADTGERGFLASYRQLQRAQQRELAQIRQLSDSAADMRSLLDAFDAAVKGWERQVASPVIAAVGSGSGNGTRVLDSRIARTSFDAVRTSAERLVELAQHRVGTARHARITDRRFLFVMLAIAAAVVLTAGIVLWRGVQRWVLGPVDHLGAQTRLVAAGAPHREITPDGPQELAMLGADVEAMRRQIAQQLSEAERTHEELRRRSADLARSNADLQQFAYVASHDLSEPLRKVASFCQLLERQYGPQLDDRARQYIDFAVDGARRMQALIADLLTLSRVGRTTEAFVPVDLAAVVAHAEADLSYRIAEAGATVHYDRLPVVAGDPALLGSLFDNLIGNAVKYRRPGVAPVVRIRAEHDSATASWLFTVADNGIGIDPQYAERIFQVFQRLHLRDEYDGTGLGLAMCRKIVEFHGGRIWLETTAPSPGATFRFTLPEGDTGADPR